MIREFEIKEYIIKFDSIVLGNEDPLCYCETENNIYVLTIEPCIINKKYLKNMNKNENIYSYIINKKLKKHCNRLQYKDINYNKYNK